MRRSNVSRRLTQVLGGISLVFAIATTTVLAQSSSSTGLTGRVADQTGASIPGATVTLTRVETGERRTIKTDSAGGWESRFLSPGIYRLVFESQGFKRLARDGVAVTTAEMATVNVQLEVGAVDQTVEVTANAEMASSGSATIVRTLDRRELEGLPTSARNFTQLLVIEPGVSADISELLSNDNASISPSVNRDAFQSSGIAFGSLGRNTVIGPDQRRVDISVSKITRLKEGLSLEFRAEAYNISNTPTFRNPARDLSGGNFGEITRTRGGPRVIQLGLKLRF